MFNTKSGSFQKEGTEYTQRKKIRKNRDSGISKI